MLAKNIGEGHNGEIFREVSSSEVNDTKIFPDPVK